MIERLVARSKTIKLGDPLLADTQMGPIATRAQFSKDETMVGRAIEHGAELLAGGARLRWSNGRTDSSSRTIRN